MLICGPPSAAEPTTDSNAPTQSWFLAPTASGGSPAPEPPSGARKFVKLGRRCVCPCSSLLNFLGRGVYRPAISRAPVCCSSILCFEQMPLLRAVKNETADETSVYFDTAKQKRRKHGLLLRVRRKGQRHLQTVKAIGTSGLFKRRE